MEKRHARYLAQAKAVEVAPEMLVELAREMAAARADTGNKEARDSHVEAV